MNTEVDDNVGFVKDILSHHGIKGMRWGIRRANPSSPTEVSVKATPGKKVETSGGQGHPPHADAIAAKVINQKLKKSGSDALSNSEMQTLITRMNLERQMSSLMKQKGNTYQDTVKFVNQMMNSPEGKIAIRTARELSKSKKARRALATAATTAALVKG